MKAYRLSLYEKSMPNSYTLREKLNLTGACGFDTMELSVDETEEKLSRLRWSRQDRRSVRESMEDTGVPISSICLSAHRKYPFGSPDDKERSRSMEIMEQAIVLASDLGIPLIQLAGYDVYYHQGDELSRRRFGEHLKQASLMAASEGILLGFETMETPFMDTVEKAMDWVQHIKSPYLGVYPDIGNLTNAAVLYGHSVTEDIRKGNGSIFAAHLKETKPGVYRDMEFGTGHTPYSQCINVLWHMGVRRFTAEFWDNGTSCPDMRIKHAADFLRSFLEEAAATEMRGVSV